MNLFRCQANPVGSCCLHFLTVLAQWAWRHRGTEADSVILYRYLINRLDPFPLCLCSEMAPQLQNYIGSHNAPSSELVTMPVTVRNGSTTGMVRYVLRTFRSNMPNSYIWYLISFYYRLKCSITMLFICLNVTKISKSCNIICLELELELEKMFIRQKTNTSRKQCDKWYIQSVLCRETLTKALRRTAGVRATLSCAKQQRGLHIFMASAYFCGMPHFLGSLLSVKVLTLGINCPHKYLPLAVDLSVQGYALFLICIATFRVVCLDEHNNTIAFGLTYVWKFVLW